MKQARCKLCAHARLILDGRGVPLPKTVACDLHGQCRAINDRCDSFTEELEDGK